MALIHCPECGQNISDRAECCPYCGLPARFFAGLPEEKEPVAEEGKQDFSALDYKCLQDLLLSFDRDYAALFSGERYIQRAAYRRSRKAKTFTGEFLRFVQEVQIANFLYLNGLDYEYEKPYLCEIPGTRKKYTPDFCITQGEHTVYLEHYSLSESGYNSRFSAEQIVTYKKSIKSKRALHRFCGTTLLETWSFYRDKRPLLEHLEEKLLKEGFQLKPRKLYDS